MAPMVRRFIRQMCASVLFRSSARRMYLYGVALGAVLGAVHRGALVALSLYLSEQPWFYLSLVPASALRGAPVGTFVGLGLGAVCGLVLWVLGSDLHIPPETERHRVVAGRACALVSGATLVLLFLFAPEDELLVYLFDGGTVDLVLKEGIPTVLGVLAAWWIGRRVAGR